MKGRDEHEDFFETGDDPIGMDRRDFIGMTAAVSAGLLVGAAGIASFPEIGRASAWAPASFPKLVLYNCQIFDGVHSQLQQDRVVDSFRPARIGQRAMGRLGDHQVVKHHAPAGHAELT